MTIPSAARPNGRPGEIPAQLREVYQQRYTEQIEAVAASDMDELGRIDAALRQVEQGHYWDERGLDGFAGGTRTYTPAAVAAIAKNARRGAPANNRGSLVFIGVLGAFFLFAIGLMVWPFVRGPVRGAAATATIAAIGDGPVSNLVEPLAAVGRDNARLPLEAPRSIEFSGLVAPVAMGSVEPSGLAKLPTGLGVRRDLAIWFSSPVNWLLAVDGDALTRLAVGDTITARTQSGRVIVFVVDHVADVAPQQIEQLAQRRPGLVLFPLRLESQASSVRLVAARYDATRERADEVASAGTALGQAVRMVDGQVAVSGTYVAGQEDGTAVVYVLGEFSSDTGAAIAAPFLEIDGQIFAPEGGSALAPGTWRLAYIVSGLGRAVLTVGEGRIDLGRLALPAVTAEVQSATVEMVETVATLSATILLSAEGGSVVVRPSDLVLLTGEGQGGGVTEIAPIEFTPRGAQVSPGQPVAITATWPLETTTGTLRLRVHGTLWEVRLPAITP